jgi:WD40 repeat protein
LRAEGQSNREGERSASPYETRNWKAESLTDQPTAFKNLDGKFAWQFSPAGRYLVSVEPGPVDESSRQKSVVIRVHEGDREFAAVASRNLDHVGYSMAISADGKRLAVASTGRDSRELFIKNGDAASVRLAVLSLPGLESVSESAVVTSNGFELLSFALSPDGKVLAASGSYRPVPFLFDTETGKRIETSTGHRDRITDCFFADATTIRTLGLDGTLCLWNAATLRCRSRVTIPPTFEVLSAHPPDGKFLVCRDNAVLRGLPTRRPATCGR